MRNTYYEPGHSRWTGITGWLMVASAIAAILCALSPVSPYPPLTAELAFAAASAAFACSWVVASYRARVGPFDKPSVPADREYGEYALPWIFAIGTPFAVAAALVVLFTGSSADGREIERLDRAGYAAHEVEIVQLAGEPVYTPPTQDGSGWYNTDLVVRVPFDSGPRETGLEGFHTSGSPEPGMRVEVHFAPAHPEEGVAEHPSITRAWLGSPIAVFFGFLGFGVAAAITKSYMDPSDLRNLRRFRPGTHLPALAILLCGLVLLLPVTLEFQVAGYNRLPAFLASLTPLAALAWVVRRRY